MGKKANAVLLLTCPDQPGIIAAVSRFIAERHGNIIHAEQHTDPEEGVFFQRIEFELKGFALDRGEIRAGLQPLLDRFAMRLGLRFTDVRPKVAVLVSKQGHCLFDLLGRFRMREQAPRAARGGGGRSVRARALHAGAECERDRPAP
ncbi:MAG: ACT domain-containing protein [Planctomycetota bacterium]